MRPSDAQLTCDGIENEIVANEAAVNARRSEIDQAQMRRTYNALAGGLIGAATSEDGSAARIEIDHIPRAQHTFAEYRGDSDADAERLPPNSAVYVTSAVLDAQARSLFCLNEELAS